MKRIPLIVFALLGLFVHITIVKAADNNPSQSTSAHSEEKVNNARNEQQINASQPALTHDQLRDYFLCTPDRILWQGACYAALYNKNLAPTYCMVTDDDKLYLWPYDRNHEDVLPTHITQVNLTEYNYVSPLKKDKNYFVLSKGHPLLGELDDKNAFVFDPSRIISPRAIDNYQDKLIRYLNEKNIPAAQIQSFYKWLKKEEMDEDALIGDIVTQLETDADLAANGPAIATSVAPFIQKYQHASLQNQLDIIPTKCPHLHAHHPIQNLLPILRCATNRYYYITFNQEKRTMLKKLRKILPLTLTNTTLSRLSTKRRPK